MFEGMIRRLRERRSDPVLWTDVLQLGKTVVAALVAWVLAVQVFDLSQPFLAPWAALLTVHATVYRSMARGAQQVGAAVLGVLVAFAAGTVFGVNVLSLGVALFLALLAGWLKGLRAEPTTAAATALVVMATGYSDDGELLVGRLLDTGIGIVVGLVVMLVVWPPLRDRSAARQIDVIDDRIGDLLCDIAGAPRSGIAEGELEGWVDRTRALDEEIDRAWRVVDEARESGRLNPRPGARPRMRAAEDFGAVLHRLEQAVAEVRSMARTVEHAHRAESEWDPSFSPIWIDLLGRTGTAIGAADGVAVQQVRAELEALACDLAAQGLRGADWPVYGALMVNLRNIVDGMHTVADAQPVRVQSPVLAKSASP
jgi:Aromatic acid exporter family member 1